ncbi:hypothetical protein K439DRAFT_1625245 [Ramaria rubella]|nr:hypothetical protein K439DRAFT_1625245 [Ramaria rubella]
MGVPLYKHIIRALYSHEPASACHYLLVAGPKGAWKQSVFSSYFQQISRIYFGVELLTTTWRQIAVAIRQHHVDSPKLAPLLNILGENDVGLQEDIGAKQVGHGLVTEQRHYATPQQLLAGTPSEILSLFIELSLRWHILLGLRTPPQRDGVEVATGDQGTAHVHHGSQEIEIATIAKITQVLNLHHTRHWLVDEIAEGFPYACSCEPRGCLLEVERASACGPVCQGSRRSSAHCITDGRWQELGIYALPAFAWEEDRVSVIIIPYVALLHDANHHLTCSGIATMVWNTWDQQAIPYMSIMLISADVAMASSKFWNWLKTLRELGKLASITINEAHIILTSITYRPILLLLGNLARLGVQLIFLTATMPPRAVHRFQELLQIPLLSVIRAPTHRFNIRYVIEHAPESVWGTHGYSELSVEYIQSFLAAIKPLLEQLNNDSMKRGIIFCRMRSPAALHSSTFTLQPTYGT